MGIKDRLHFLAMNSLRMISLEQNEAMGVFMAYSD
jgi:hypothetical protein